MRFIDRKAIEAFVEALDAAFARPGQLYLIGETTHVAEGWCRWTEELTCAAEVDAADRAAFEDAVQHVATDQGIAVWEESPADVIPLPDGVAERARLPETLSVRCRHLTVAHFDPYSVAFRFIARGDEPDYHLVLAYLEHGWITFDAMDTLLVDLLPRFSMETIQQDPAEFRRKYKGLRQMAQSIQYGTIHRHTPT